MIDDDEDSPLYCPVARTYCEREFCERGLCEREALASRTSTVGGNIVVHEYKPREFYMLGPKKDAE